MYFWIILINDIVIRKFRNASTYWELIFKEMSESFQVNGRVCCLWITLFTMTLSWLSFVLYIFNHIKLKKIYIEKIQKIYLIMWLIWDVYKNYTFYNKSFLLTNHATFSSLQCITLDTNIISVANTHKNVFLRMTGQYTPSTIQFYLYSLVSTFNDIKPNINIISWVTKIFCDFSWYCKGILNYQSHRILISRSLT